MKKFEIVVCAYGTLERVQRYVIEARDVDHARTIGIARSEQPGYLVGAQAV